MADSSVIDLPWVGDPLDYGAPFLSSYLNRLRTEALMMRGNFTGDLQTCLNLYLEGAETPGQPHVINKVQGMINSFVQRAIANMPMVTIKPVTVKDGGPVVMTTGQKAVILDSTALSDWMNDNWKALWKKGRGAQFYKAMAFYGKLFGWQNTLLDWDFVEKSWLWYVIPALQWYLDPLNEEIDKANYIGLDWPVDAEWAKRTWAQDRPKLAEAIDQAAARVVKQTPASTGYSDVFVNEVYARPIVTMSIWWIRNREMAMAPDEAMGHGVVGTPDGEFSMTGDNGKPMKVWPASGTGDKRKDEHPNWPRKLVTSYTIQIENQIVVDEELDGPVPVVANFNVRIPNRPYGQSDCLRVRTLQTDRNSVHASQVKHVGWFKGPTFVMPKSIRSELGEGFRNFGMEPNKTYWMEDLAYQKAMQLSNGKLFQVYEAAAMPPALMDMGHELDTNFDVAGGRPDVSQGNAPTKNSSGVLVESLMSAANSTSDFTFQYLEEMMERTAKIILHYCLTRLSPQDLANLNRTYDLQTTTMILQAVQNMEWDIEITSGSAKYQKEAQVRQDLQAGIIDMQTARELLGYDNDTIEMRRQQMAMNQQAAAGAVPGAGNGSEGRQLQSPGAASNPSGSMGAAQAA